MSAEPGGTLLLSGTDLATVCVVRDLADFWSSADPRGDLSSFVGTDGVAALRRPTSSQVRTAQLDIVGDSVGDAEDLVADVKALLRVGTPQTGTRRKITSAGNLDASQTVVVRSAAERWVGKVNCTILASIETLDGLWYGSAVSISSVAGTQSIDGDVPTHKMTVTLAAGAARTVTNNTNGHWLTFGTTVPSGGVEIDVEARTAIAVTGDVDMSQYLSWGKTYPMRLDPGSNSIAVSAVSAAISYQPAYQ